jgi:hypothetical protein
MSRGTINELQYFQYATILFLVVMLISSCSILKKSSADSNHYFEGVITYDIDYDIPDSLDFTVNQLKEFVGAKMVMKFKEGNHLKQFYSSNGRLLNERVLLLEEKRYYNIVSDLDTLFYLDITKPETKTEFTRVKDSIIFNQVTIAIETNSIVPDLGYGAGPQNFVGRYHFSKELLIDPDWFKDYAEANYYEIMKMGKGIHLAFITRGRYWKQIMTAVSIQQKEVEMIDIKGRLNFDFPLREL